MPKINIFKTNNKFENSSISEEISEFNSVSISSPKFQKKQSWLDLDKISSMAKQKLTSWSNKSEIVFLVKLKLNENGF